MKKGITASDSFKKESIPHSHTQKLAKESIPGDSDSRNRCKPTRVSAILLLWFTSVLNLNNRFNEAIAKSATKDVLDEPPAGTIWIAGGRSEPLSPPRIGGGRQPRQRRRRGKPSWTCQHKPKFNLERLWQAPRHHQGSRGRRR